MQSWAGALPSLSLGAEDTPQPLETDSSISPSAREFLLAGEVLQLLFTLPHPPFLIPPKLAAVQNQLTVRFHALFTPDPPPGKTLLILLGPQITSSLKPSLTAPCHFALLRQYLPPLRGFRDPHSSAALGTLSYSSLADSLLPIPAPAQPRVPEGPALQCLSSSHPTSRPWFPYEYIQLQTQPLSSQAALAAPNHHSIPLKQAQAPPGEAPSRHKGFLSSHTWLFGKCPTPAPLLPIQGNHVPSSGYLNYHRASVSASAKHGHLPPQEAVGRTEWDDITRRFAQALADPSCNSWWPSY